MSMVVPSIARVTGCSLFFLKTRVSISQKKFWKVLLKNLSAIFLCSKSAVCLVPLAAGSWQSWPWLSHVSTCLLRVTGPVLRSPSISVICWPQPCCHLRYDFFLLLHHPVHSAVIYRLVKIWTDLCQAFVDIFFHGLISKCQHILELSQLA